MSGMNKVYFEFLGEQSKKVLKYVGLVNRNGEEVSEERKEAVWKVQEVLPEGKTNIENDRIIAMVLMEDLVFDIVGDKDNPVEVAGWRLFDSVERETNYGGRAVQNKEYTDEGTYTLYANKIFVNFDNFTK